MGGSRDASGGISWPPPYTVRESARARSARLRVVPGSGLEIVVPRGMRSFDIDAALERNRKWILRALDRVAAPAPDPGCGSCPGSLSLHGGRCVIPLMFSGTRSAGCDAPSLPSWNDPRLALSPEHSFSETPLPLILADGSRERRLALVRHLVRTYARRYLGAGLWHLSRESGLEPAAYTVRLQKSRWGSCSAKGHLSLNLCLIFLPPALSRHVLLHELCHLRHMDHSDMFWKLLFSLEPDALELDRRLRRAWKYVPAWIW